MGVDKTWGRPWPRPWCRPWPNLWPTLWPSLWPTGGQIFKSIALLQTFQHFTWDCLTNDFRLLSSWPRSDQDFLTY